MRQGTGRTKSADWHAELRSFVVVCDASRAEDQADRIREAWELCCGLADSVASPIRLPSADRLEALLAVGAFENAVLALLGPQTGYLLSRGGGGLALASVILPDSDNDQTASGETPALALLSALALALLGGMEELARRMDHAVKRPAASLLN